MEVHQRRSERPTRAHRRPRRRRPHARRITAPTNTSPKFRARPLSAIMLLVMGGIHLYLVFDGVGGPLGVLFVLNAVGALVLAIAIIVLRGRLLSLATGLSLLFMVGTLLALVL